MTYGEMCVSYKYVASAAVLYGPYDMVLWVVLSSPWCQPNTKIRLSMFQTKYFDDKFEVLISDLSSFVTNITVTVAIVTQATF